ncbi:MAG: family 78 glycoside hydrolase catalytic domain [Fimbriimonadaceae bacterium]
MKVRDENGVESGWSAPAWFERGLVDESHWQARWIGLVLEADPGVAGPAPHLRRLFEIEDKPVSQARLYATARGVYVAEINGRRVGDDALRPGWTDYHRRFPYQTYDVTDLVRPGRNAVGLIVADGWACGQVGLANRNQYGQYPAVMARLEVTYLDGTQTVVVTDGQWRGSSGPVLRADLLQGEHYDARLEMPGWSTADFDDASWRPVFSTDRGHVPIVAQTQEPVRVVEEIRPVGIAEPEPGVFIFDLGQNMVGWVRLTVAGPAGTEITLRHAEMLDADGSLYVTNLRTAAQTDRYVLKGSGTEVWEPRFTFHGFRYVEVRGWPGKPGLDAVVGRVATSDTPPNGTFSCSHPMVNQLQHNIRWGQRGNYLEVPTDCPQRDERLGWMGDAQIFIRTATHNADVAAFMTKWMEDVADAVSPCGAYPNVAPNVARDGVGWEGAPAWADAGVIVPWTIFRVYGDRELLARHYPLMRNYVERVHRLNPDLIWRHGGGPNFGDWLSIEADTDKVLLGTAYFALSTGLVAAAAAELGYAEDAARFSDLRERIAAKFRETYVRPDGSLSNPTQTSYVLALQFGLLPPDQVAPAVENLVSDIGARGGRLSTGFVGVGHLLPTLADHGRADVAYHLLLSDEFPSWGYEIKHGATTIWERWDGWTHDKGFQDPGMNSFNHYAFGAVGEFLYRYVAGIDLAEDSAGFRDLVFRPRPGAGIDAASATFRTACGLVESSWAIDDGQIRYEVRVPANSKATIWVPTRAADSVRVETAGGRPPTRIDEADGAVRYGAGPGRFTFFAAEPVRIPYSPNG